MANKKPNIIMLALKIWVISITAVKAIRNQIHNLGIDGIMESDRIHIAFSL